MADAPVTASSVRHFVDEGGQELLVVRQQALGDLDAAGLEQSVQRCVAEVNNGQSVFNLAEVEFRGCLLDETDHFTVGVLLFS